ncbi:MAG: 3-keto-5-aminohexanoate cleavage protein, partial [Pseudomonadota bacterium]|nr:3-keto-5-aminohexanoate cleavage protein [Pseudomonadota bacterium]
MRSTADRLFGRDGYAFSVLGAGRHQMGLVTMGAIMGGHVRVGLEDSLYIARGKLAQSCAEQVTKIRTLLEALSLEIASPDEARTILATKGPEKTALAR